MRKKPLVHRNDDAALRGHQGHGAPPNFGACSQAVTFINVTLLLWLGRCYGSYTFAYIPKLNLSFDQSYLFVTVINNYDNKSQMAPKGLVSPFQTWLLTSLYSRDVHSFWYQVVGLIGGLKTPTSWVSQDWWAAGSNTAAPRTWDRTSLL